MAEGDVDLSGLVLDPCLEDRHGELRAEARQHGLEVVLDPRTIDLSTPGGIQRGGVTQLPWAGDAFPQGPDLLGGASGDFLTEALAQHAVDERYDAVLAPTHYLADGAQDPWVEIDGRLTRALRRRLDQSGRRETRIYYPLALPGTALRNVAHRRALISALGRLPIDALWLRVHPFGTTSSGPLALRRYIEACRDLHSLAVPLVAEHTGTVGLALLAFGAVGGIESGITYGERYNVGPLFKPPSTSNPFSPPPRVYIERLGAFLTRDQAQEFFENRHMKTLFACKASGCCPRGAADMAKDPRRHFIIRRTSEVAYYSRPPEPVRGGLYLDEFLRPATDLAMRAARVAPVLEPTRRRLEGWRQALGAMNQQGPPSSVAMSPQGRRVQPHPHAVGE